MKKLFILLTVPAALLFNGCTTAMKPVNVAPVYKLYYQYPETEPVLDSSQVATLVNIGLLDPLVLTHVNGDPVGNMRNNEIDYLEGAGFFKRNAANKLFPSYAVDVMPGEHTLSFRCLPYDFPTMGLMSFFRQNLMRWSAEKNVTLPLAAGTEYRFYVSLNPAREAGDLFDPAPFEIDVPTGLFSKEARTYYLHGARDYIGLGGTTGLPMRGDGEFIVFHKYEPPQAPAGGGMGGMGGATGGAARVGGKGQLTVTTSVSVSAVGPMQRQPDKRKIEGVMTSHLHPANRKLIFDHLRNKMQNK